jgi:hypothetical protein
MNNDLLEKELKESRLYAFVFLGLFCLIAIAAFYFSLSGAILNHNIMAIIGAVVSGFFIILIIGTFIFCLSKKREKKEIKK